MKKLLNTVSTYVDESLAGLVAATPYLELAGAAGRVVTTKRRSPSRKVGIASGGGFGHLPLFTGYVGPGLLDTCAVGNVFEGPNVASCLDAVRLADAGAGVLLLFGNYGGDRMNFSMAAETLEDQDIATRTVLVCDDIASAAPSESHRRRGVAGTIFAYKIAGAMADRGASLDQVADIARRAVASTRTIGLALSSCQVPGAGKPTFELAQDEIEMGIGIHGEPGIWRDALRPADMLVDEMITRLLAEKPANASGRAAVLVNGLGATPIEELFILYRRVAEKLTQSGIDIVQPLIGPYATSMEMAGFSISLLFLDDELEELLAAPAECPFWKVS